MKKQRVAISLNFDGTRTPEVGVIGKARFAEEVERRARRYGIPVKRNDELAAELAKVEANNEIPAHLYDVVADLLFELERNE